MVPFGDATLSTRPTLIIDGERHDRIPAADSCHDCGQSAGEIHWHGCDMEECPSCGGQLISCPCTVLDPGGKVDR